MQQVSHLPKLLQVYSSAHYLRYHLKNVFITMRLIENVNVIFYNIQTEETAQKDLRTLYEMYMEILMEASIFQMKNL